jgi:hypothetical protein
MNAALLAGQTAQCIIALKEHDAAIQHMCCMQALAFACTSYQAMLLWQIWVDDKALSHNIQASTKLSQRQQTQPFNQHPIPP